MRLTVVALLGTELPRRKGVGTMTDRTIRWGGLAGVIFVVLILITVFAGGSMPKPDASVVKIQKYFVDHRRGLLVSNFVGLAAIPFALWFGVVLRELVRRERLASVYGTALLAGLLVTAPMALVGGVLEVAAVYVSGAAGQFDANLLRLVFDAQGLAFVATSAGIVTFALASAGAIRRSGALPAYTMWLALLAVLGNVLTMISALGARVAALGIVGVATFGLFILITGIAMATGKGAAATAAA